MAAAPRAHGALPPPHEICGVAEASFLRNPADPRDWNDAPSAAGDRRGTSDRFVLKFVKPG